MKRISSFQIFSGFGLFLSLLFILGAYGIEYFYHLIPCPLCLLQRYTLIILCTLFLLGTIHNPAYLGRIFYLSLILCFSVLSAFLAGRQIWLQHLPLDQVPNCSADIERMLQFLPITEVLKSILMGGGECAKIDFILFGLPLANYSFMVFIGFILYSVIYCPLKQQRRT